MDDYGMGGGGDNDDLLLDFLLEQGSMQPEVQDIGRRRAMVEQLRSQSQVPTEARNAGRLVVARSPLEMLAPAIGQGIASYKERGIDQAAAGLQTKKLAGIEALRGRMGKGMGMPRGSSAFPQRPMPGEDSELLDPSSGYASPL